MTPALIPILPDSAPFTPAQRAWLNGFLAGAMNLQPGAAAAAAPSAVELRINGSVISENGNGNGHGHGGNGSAANPAASPAAAEEEFPWHDSALSLDERMKLAEAKPYSRRLMAAMAQLDCGSCGYLCKTYAEAIADGTDRDLTKCTPGGKETVRKLKELVAAEGAGGNAPTVPAAPVAPAAPVNYGRHNPYAAKLVECRPLNKTGTMKDTRLVVLDLKGSGLTYNVGDALGVFPENEPETVRWLIATLGATGAEDVMGPDGQNISLYEAMARHYSLGKPTDLLFELLINTATSPDDAAELKRVLAHDAVADGDEVVDLLRQFPSARPEPAQFVAALNPLQPRLYSISSSQKAHPDEVHLTVGVVRYRNTRSRQCVGVCSTFFADRVRPGQRVRVFVHPSHGFAVPADGGVPMIMVGPGTGVAPFRAFLQERKATGATGRNWLIFGDQQRRSDFLFEDELEAYRADGPLTRLDTAFSRDQDEKVYVQHRMREQAAEIWTWLQAGAHFYVCGDAKRMATDVDQALRDIVAEQGRMTPEAAKAYVAELSKSKRYQRDVY